MKKIISISTVILLGLFVSSCSTNQPKDINNACSIIHENPDWYYSMIDSYNRWGIPINVQMAFIRKESSFIADAKPPMKYLWGFIPEGRASSAYGYSQALDGTWDHYKKQTKQTFVSRTNYADATDFIGWYLNDVHNQTGISKKNTYDLYLAYHEGINGYKRGRHKSQPGLLKYARQTANVANKYSSQLQRCSIPRKPFMSYI